MTVSVSGMWKRTLWAAALAATIAAGAPGAARGQQPLPDPHAAAAAANAVNDPAQKAGKALLLDLEARFAKDVLERGGAAFADWFAEDGVALGNGQPPAIGRAAIAKSATWSPKVYQLLWLTKDAVMGPSGDIGYTWGHFEGHSKDVNGHPVTTNGRYITIWRKQPDGNWKVVLDAGANEPANAGDCCKLPETN